MGDKLNINDFPLTMNGYEVYDIVYLGDAMLNYSDSGISKVLKEEYVFVFVTLLTVEKDSHSYGNVKIEFVKHELLSCFNSRIRERGTIHILGKENLKINDFIEIVHEETDHGKRIVVELKNQNIMKNYHTEVAYKKDFRILLVQENDFDNTPMLELGPEFSLKLEYDMAKVQVCKLRNALNVLGQISRKDGQNIDAVQLINKTKEILEKEIEDAKQKEEQLFNDYLGIMRNTLYIHKRAD
ncbi:hypothetical protein [Clostridium saccharoperbutylacetonicum]|uniref:hypothetical protein n=1 Tax=Clostridium saccharoperbutylacetonicum TaxID=36745 RepID=UPI000983F929|nr:hypothetical protein [Clostridium saccharoperbutylacetonicum]AQR95589.1 hypothetical protein CLSAP_29050 [Clostridium saccharoperbutylacetonicum]NSB31449.1 hypothetical protein [Clostridium saccharoperbutylacetonicum]